LKWGRRRPALAAALASTLLASAVLTGGALWSAGRLRHERDLAEAARRDAVASEGVKEQGLSEGEQARPQTQAHLLDPQTTLGLFASEQQKPAQAVLWFANAAALAGDDPERERLNRVRCQVWRHVNVMPARAFAAGEDGLAALAFDPSERYLLAQ